MIHRSIYALAAALMTVSAFASTVAVMAGVTGGVIA